MALGLVGFGPAASTVIAATPQAPATAVGASPDFDGDGLPGIVYAINGEIVEGSVRIV